MEKTKDTAQAAGAKEECLAVLSHAVRTAMHSIINTADAVLLAELKPEQRDDLTTIKDSAQTLLVEIPASVMMDPPDLSAIPAEVRAAAGEI